MKRMIICVCGGNTCRSPMAKVILEQKLAELGKLNHFGIDSAAYDAPTLTTASKGAKEAIMALYGEDILASHMPKKLTAGLARQADLILVMSTRMTKGLPENKTHTLREYAGLTGDVPDPFGGDASAYLKTANDISGVMDKVIPRLLSP
jgi:protein-tyrosine-phosphatase